MSVAIASDAGISVWAGVIVPTSTQSTGVAVRTAAVQSSAQSVTWIPITVSFTEVVMPKSGSGRNSTMRIGWKPSAQSNGLESTSFSQISGLLSESR